MKMNYKLADVNSNNLKDERYMCIILFYSLGMITMLPLNFLTTAQDYWNYKFRDPSLPYNAKSAQTKLQKTFTADITVIIQLTLFLGLIILSRYLKTFSINLRIYGALCGVLLHFFVTIVLAICNTDFWQDLFFVFTLGAAFFLTCCTACFMMTCFQLVSQFPQKYTAALLTGQTMCGILSALVEIITLAAGAKNQQNGLYYFLIGSVCVAFTFINYYVNVNYMDYFKFHYANKSADEVEFSKRAFVSVMKRQKFYLLSIVLVLASASMLQPGVTSKIDSVDKGSGNEWNDVYFGPVVTFFLYNFMDLIGRQLAAAITREINDKLVFILSLSRLILVPLILMCNVSIRQHTRTLINSDVAYIIIIMLFGFSTGCITNMAIMNIPRKAREGERHLIGVLILLAVFLGIGIFAFVGVVIIRVL